jgi:hypothetical protein
MTFWEAFVLLLVYVPLMLIWATSILDIFRRDDIGGVRKALWLVAVILLPLLGTLIYLIARPAGATRSEREVLDAASRDFVARYAPNGHGSQLQLLAELHDRGKLTDAEFQAEKSRVMGTSLAG